MDKHLNECITLTKKYQRFSGIKNYLTFSNCIDTYHKTYFDNLLEHTGSMILSLVRLLKFTRNSVFKHHDILPIVLL